MCRKALVIIGMCLPATLPTYDHNSWSIDWDNAHVLERVQPTR